MATPVIAISSIDKITSYVLYEPASSAATMSYESDVGDVTEREVGKQLRLAGNDSERAGVVADSTV